MVERNHALCSSHFAKRELGGAVGKSSQNMFGGKKDPDLEASAEGDGVTEGLEGKERGLGKSQGRITCRSVERQRPVSRA